MSLNARRFAEKCLHPIEVPTLPKINAEDASRMPLLARVVREEHEITSARSAFYDVLRHATLAYLIDRLESEHRI